MKNNIIRVTGNNRKAVLAFLDKHMIGSHKPKNNPYFIVCRDNCYIELKNDYFTTHLEYNGPTMTLKEVRKQYEPKQTENEKKLQARGNMYKMKYDKLKESNDELKDYTAKVSDDVLTLMGLNNELKKEYQTLINKNISLDNDLRIQNAVNKDSFLRYEKVQNELNTHKEKVTKLTEDRDTHLQLNSDLRVTNTRLTDEMVELEGKYNDLWKSNQYNTDSLVKYNLDNLELNKQLSAKSFELDQSKQSNKNLIKEKYRYIAMIALLIITVITLCVLK